MSLPVGPEARELTQEEIEERTNRCFALDQNVGAA